MPKAKPKAKQGQPFPAAPLVAPKSPARFRVRVRMYRHGLGDCFLLTFPRPGRKRPFNLLIDCGALGVASPWMQGLARHIRDTVRGGGGTGKARLDLIVATHEHRDHLSGFNQARDVFEKEFEVGAVWMGWTENLTQPEIRKIKEARRKTVTRLERALESPTLGNALSDSGQGIIEGARSLLGFSGSEGPGTRTIAEALEYLKSVGEKAGDLQFLEPGAGPISLPDVEGVRVYVLGPPRDPLLLKGSEVTERMKQDGVIYHLSQFGAVGVDSLASAANVLSGADSDRCQPFAPEFRITRTQDLRSRAPGAPHPYFRAISAFVAGTYDDPDQAWRRIDEDWFSAFGQLALDLDNDTNNTSLVLAFEFEKSGEVLLFVGDAQVGNWQSWAKVEFTVPGRAKPMPAHDLLGRTVFYKVGHHCSHNGTLKAGGLELMNRKGLVAFVPLDEATARKQGKKGWDMPAGPLFKALQDKTAGRVVLSDVSKAVPPAALKAGVRETRLYLDYFLT